MCKIVEARLGVLSAPPEPGHQKRRVSTHDGLSHASAETRGAERI